MFQGKEFNMMHGLRWHDHGARFADNTILRWTTMDPLCEKYYDTSPYVFCGNNPLKYVDPNGKKIKFAKGVSKQFMQNFALAVQYLKDHKCDGLIARLESLKETVYIKEISGESSEFNYEEKTIYWDPYTGLRTTNAFLLSPTIALNHEADHALQFLINPKEYKNNIIIKDKDYKNKEERRVITGSEQRTAKLLGEIGEKETTRTDHSAIPFPTINPISNEEVFGTERDNILEGVDVLPDLYKHEH